MLRKSESKFRSLAATVTLSFFLVSGSATAQDDVEKFDFAHKILPLLKKRCAKCHANGTYKGGFSIDTRETIVEAINVGSANDSELFQRITSDDPDERMPPDGEPLSKEEIAQFKKWIDGKLEWEKGFSFKTKSWKAPLWPREVLLPSGDGNPIDLIVNQYFQKNNIKPTGSIDNATFLRRAYLDIIGILPTEQEQQAFSGNDRNDKRKILINELLARDHDYADHWMSFWNDLLRNDYAGTGFIDGGRKQITTWLHQSLYENKPYDQFVRELINPTPPSTGFIKGIKWRGEVNASQVREVQFAQNVAQVFLGENLKCASCHDSFINDWKLVDAYGMAAIIADKPLEMFRCDKPTGKQATAKFLWPELGGIDPDLSKQQRLARTADLITAKENGRFARTIINRIWQRMMGRGIVEPVDMMGNRPFNEDLLNFLANHLVENKFDIKKSIELITNSKIYQSQTVSEKKSPTGPQLFRGPMVRRLTAEQFVDAIWHLTDTAPKNRVAKINQYETAKTPRAVRASLVVSNPLMRSLGRPNREQVVTSRIDQLSTLQALDLSNGRALAELIDKGADKIIESKKAPDEIIDQVYRQALCRKPTADEAKSLKQIVTEKPNRESVADLLWTVIMLPEFQHVR